SALVNRWLRVRGARRGQTVDRVESNTRAGKARVARPAGPVGIETRRSMHRLASDVHLGVEGRIRQVSLAQAGFDRHRAQLGILSVAHVVSPVSGCGVRSTSTRSALRTKLRWTDNLSDVSISILV